MALKIIRNDNRLLLESQDLRTSNFLQTVAGGLRNLANALPCLMERERAETRCFSKFFLDGLKFEQ